MLALTLLTYAPDLSGIYQPHHEHPRLDALAGEIDEHLEEVDLGEIAGRIDERHEHLTAAAGPGA